MIYSLRALLDKQPVTISGAVFALINVLVVAKVIDVSAETISAANTALALLLGLFVNAKTTNSSDLDDIKKGGK